MSGPVNPPLKVTDGTTSIRPTRTITFDAAEFTVTDNGNGNARIDIDAGGSADLTDTYIGFGSASNLLTGSANFTFTEETGGNGPTVLLTGDKPIFQMRDDTAATLYRTEFVQSGASMFIFHRDSTGTDRELLRLSNSYIRINDDGLDIDVKMEGENVDHLFSLDAAQDNIGIATSPNSNTLLHISDDGTKANTVRIESTDNDTSVGPVLDLRRNNADGTATDGDNLGVIQFSGLDDGGGSETYARIRASAADTHSTLAEGAIEFLAAYNNVETEVMRIGPIGDGGAANFGVDVNYNSQSTVDFRVRGDTVDNLLYADVSNNFVGIGRYPSGAERLVVSGTGSSDPTVMIESTATDLANEGPQLEFYRAANLEDGDRIGVIRFSAQDDGGNKTEYGRIEMMIADETTPQEDGEMIFYLTENGSIEQEYFRIRGASRQIEMNTGQDDIDFVINSDAVANFFFVNANQNNASFGGTLPVSGGATLQIPDNTISHYCNVNTIRSDAVTTMVMVNEDCQGQMWVHDSVNAHTIQLPEGGVKGMHFQFMSTDGNITVDPQGSDTLNGGTASLTRSTNYEIYDVFCYDTGKWALSNPA